MQEKEVYIRPAAETDAAALLEIYAPYVRDTVVTYEYEPPTEAEFQARIRATLEQYPYLVAETAAGEILGYAYAGAFRSRAAYQWTAEVTVYLRAEAHGRGIGRALYARLEEALRRQNVQTLVALIADPNPASVAFHEALGYREVGRLSRCAYKLGQWLGLIWMEKPLGAYADPPAPFLPQKK